MAKLPVENIDQDLLNQDWLGSVRLMKKAAKGDAAARKELKERENTKYVPLTEEEKDEIRRRLYGDS